jgi:hypothetical protein
MVGPRLSHARQWAGDLVRVPSATPTRTTRSLTTTRSAQAPKLDMPHAQSCRQGLRRRGLALFLRGSWPRWVTSGARVDQTRSTACLSAPEIVAWPVPPLAPHHARPRVADGSRAPPAGIVTAQAPPAGGRSTFLEHPVARALRRGTAFVPLGVGQASEEWPRSRGIHAATTDRGVMPFRTAGLGCTHLARARTLRARPEARAHGANPLEL